MAGERDLVADAERGAGQGGNDRFAAAAGFRVHAGALNLAQQPVEIHGAVEEALGGIFASHFLHFRDDVEIHASGKIRLSGGDDDPLHRVVGQCRIHEAVKLVHAVEREHVHRLALEVPDDGGHAVGVGGGGENAHLGSPSCGAT